MDPLRSITILNHNFLDFHFPIYDQISSMGFGQNKTETACRSNLSLSKVRFPPVFFSWNWGAWFSIMFSCKPTTAYSFCQLWSSPKVWKRSWVSVDIGLYSLQGLDWGSLVRVVGIIILIRILSLFWFWRGLNSLNDFSPDFPKWHAGRYYGFGFCLEQHLWRLLTYHLLELSACQHMFLSIHAISSAVGIQMTPADRAWCRAVHWDICRSGSSFHQTLCFV